MVLDEKGDVGFAEDMAFTLRNLIAIEDHAVQSYEMSKDEKWLQLLDMVRKIRTKWLSLITKKEKSHIWCISKHLLASAMGLIEISTRFNQTRQTKEADAALSDASNLITVFLILNGYEERKAKVVTSA